MKYKIRYFFLESKYLPPKTIGFITDKHVEARKKRAVGNNKGRIMKISQKLFLGFFTIVSLVVIVGSICIYQLHKIAEPEPPTHRTKAVLAIYFRRVSSSKIDFCVA